MTDQTTRIHSMERAAGKRAHYHVYSRSPKGKVTFDPSWATTPQQAQADMEAAHRQLRTLATVVRVVSLADVEL